MPTFRRRARAPRRRRSELFGGTFAALTCATLIWGGLSTASVRAATITVDTTNDNFANDGVCSIREAIVAANGDTAVFTCAAGSGADTLHFALGAGTPTIAVGSPALPPITEQLRIDGSSGGATRVRLNANNTGAGADGLVVNATFSAIEDMVITGFDGNGVELGGGGTTISGSLIGTNGTADLGNGDEGVVVTSSNNHVGPNNVVSGNDGEGVAINDDAGVPTNGNSVFGNRIGTNAAATSPIPNAGTGIRVLAGTGNRIGGTDGVTVGGPCTGSCNLVSGNRGDGVAIDDAATDTDVFGNFIGTNADGSGAIANDGDGVRVSTSGNQIGGTGGATARNVIAGNGAGVRIADGAPPTPSPSDNTVVGNFIGPDASGTAAVGNFDGVVVSAGSGNTIGRTFNVTVGGACTGSCNLVSGNARDGIKVIDATETTVVGNLVGTTVSGDAPLGNQTGITVGGLASATTIGGNSEPARNVVGGNDRDGLRLEADGTQVLGNYIGLGTGGTTDLGNGRNGVTIVDATGNTIGGGVPDARNVISGNEANGVDMAGGTANTIAGNFIGTDAAGSTPVGNGRLGVRIASLSSANTIGGDVSGAENLLRGNGDDAIGVVDGAGDGNVIARNVGSAPTAPFIDLDPADGPGNDPATGPHGGAQPPVVAHAHAEAADGSAPPGATVRVFGSAGAPGSAPADIQDFLGSATADATGAWRASYGAAVPEGTGVTATQTTAAGTSELSAVRTTDSIPPDTTIVSGPADGSAPVTVTDTSKPVVERFGVTNKVFRRGSSRTPLSIARRRPRGTAFRFRSSEAGVVKLVIERVLTGRRVGRRCLADSRARRRRPRCTRFVRVVTLTRTGTVGQNRIAFSGRAGTRALSTGRFRGSVQVTDAAGNASNLKRVSFRIVK